IESLDGNAAGLEQLLAVAHGIKSGWPRAQCPYARMLQPRNDFTGRGESSQIRAEFFARRVTSMEPRKRIANAVLPEIVANRHLPAKTVAPIADGHFGSIIVEGVNEHRHIQIGPAKCVRNCALVAEVWQSHYDALNLLPVLFEQVSAFLSIVQGL